MRARARERVYVCVCTSCLGFFLFVASVRDVIESFLPVGEERNKPKHADDITHRCETTPLAKYVLIVANIESERATDLEAVCRSLGDVSGRVMSAPIDSVLTSEITGVLLGEKTRFDICERMLGYSAEGNSL